MRPNLLLAVTLGLAVSAGVVLALGAWSPEAGRAGEFQHLVGGLGFGPALDLSRCEPSFDPRLCPACTQDVGPLPGGMIFCPHHTGLPDS